MIVYALLLGVCAYLIWGITHHWHRGDLHPKIVLEYLGIATLGTAIVLGVLNLL